MKKKNLALRMSAFMMSALLVIGSAAPAYAAADLVTEDQQADAKSATEATAETGNASKTENEEGTESSESNESREITTGESDNDAAAGEEGKSDSESVTEENASDSADEALQEEEDAIESEEEDLQEDVGEESSEVSNSFVFGSSQIQLGEGSYSLPVALMNASSISNASMAGSCIAGDATLEVLRLLCPCSQ